MLVFTGELSNQIGIGYDFLYLGLEGGRLVVKFNNEGGLDFLTEIRTSDVLVNDMELHRVQILFRSGNVDMLVDNSNRVTLTGEREEGRLQNVTEYGHLPFSLPPSVSRTTMTHPPDVWLGGVPSSFVPPQHPSLDFSTFRGCLHDFTHSTTEDDSPLIIDPVTAVDGQYVNTTSTLSEHLPLELYNL